jgi:hypothetical protein
MATVLLLYIIRSIQKKSKFLKVCWHVVFLDVKTVGSGGVPTWYVCVW